MKISKELSKKCKNMLCLVGLTILTVAMFAGCGKKTVQSSEDIQEESQTYETLVSSNANKFSYDDLIVNKLKMGMPEDQIKAILGEPVNFYDSNEVKLGDTKKSIASTDILDERVYSYNDLTLIFMPIDGTYKLCAAASIGDQDVFSRGIKVGDSKDKIFDLYYRDVDCLNNNVMTEDNATILGKFLYGSNTIDTIQAQNAKDKIEYGIINYNGYDSFETASAYIIEFTYFEPPYIKESATVNDDFAQVAFDIDANGIITGIRWYYYPEING